MGLDPRQVERQAAGTRSSANSLRVTAPYDDVYGGALIAVGPPLDRTDGTSGALKEPSTPHSLPRAGGNEAAFASAEPWTYIYDEQANRFRDVRSGQFIATDELRRLRDDFVATRTAAVEDLARQLGSGTLGLDEWQAAMRAEIKMVMGVEYAFGRGGMLAMDAGDWQALEGLVARQWQYLDGFATALGNGELSPAQLVQRAGMYVNAGITAYDRGLAAAHDVYDELPEYPGEACDGMSNCRCSWVLDEQDDGSVDCYWLAEGDANTCDPCAQNARDYNPLTIDADSREGPPAFRHAGKPATNPWTRALPERPANFGAVPVAAVHAEQQPVDLARLTAYVLDRLDVREPRVSLELAIFDDSGGHWVTVDGNHIFIGDSAGSRYAIGITGDQFAAAGIGDHVHSSELRMTLGRLDAHHVALSIGRGGWKDDSGKLYEENSLALQFSDGQPEQVTQEMAQLGRQWNQQAVLVQRYVNSGGEPQATINLGRRLSDGEVSAIADNLKDQFGGWTFSTAQKTGATHLTVSNVKAWGGPADPEFRRQVQAVGSRLRESGLNARVAWRQVENYPLDTSPSAKMSEAHARLERAIGISDSASGRGHQGSAVQAARNADVRAARGAGPGDAVPGDVSAAAPLEARIARFWDEHELAAFRYSFASTQANLPPELAQAMAEYQQSAIDPNDLAEHGLEDEPHVTIRYGLHADVTAEQVAEALATLGPIEVTFGDVAAFPEGDNGVPLYVAVQGSGLHDAHHRLAGVPHTDTHPEYQPHATIAYLKPGTESKYVGSGSPLKGKRAVLDAIQFSPTDGAMTEIPLAPRVGFGWITLDDGRHVFVDETTDAARSAMAEVPRTKGDAHGDGSLKNPLYVDGDLDKAASAIAAGQHVRMDQPAQVSTLIDKLGAMAQDAESKGDKAPLYDLGLVAIPGTNLFTQDSKGIARVEMPQLQGATVPGSPAAKAYGAKANLTAEFRAQLAQQGYTVTDETVPAANLRATQQDLNGATVAGIMRREAAGTLPDQRIFVTQDQYILDGHHRWAARVGADLRDNTLGDVTMPVARVNTDIGTMLDLTRIYVGAMGITQGRSAASARTSSFSALRRRLADAFTRIHEDTGQRPGSVERADAVPFAGDGGEHWITLDDGRHILIGGEPERQPGGGPARVAQQERSVALATLKRTEKLPAIERAMSAAIPGHPRADLGTLDAARFRPAAVALAEVGQDYPEAAARLTLIADASSPQAASVGLDQIAGTNASAATGYPGRGQCAIAFNPTHYSRTYGDADPVPQMVRDAAASGWFPPEAADQGAAYHALHEFGHVVDIATRENAPDVPSWGSRFHADKVSQYARIGGEKEDFAETFAAYYLGSESPAAKDMGTFLKAAFGSAPRRAAATSATHAAGFAGEFGWITLDDGRHVMIGEDAATAGLQRLGYKSMPFYQFFEKASENARGGEGSAAFITPDGSLYDIGRAEHPNVKRRLTGGPEGQRIAPEQVNQLVEVLATQHETNVRIYARPTHTQMDAIHDAVTAYPRRELYFDLDPDSPRTAVGNGLSRLRQELGKRYGVTFADEPAGFAGDDGEGRWVTIDGSHVLIGARGEILQGGSHLTGASGKGAVYYHGGHLAPGQSIDASHLAGRETGGSQHGPGLYLATTPDGAKHYAKASGGDVVAVHVPEGLKLLGEGERLSAAQVKQVRDALPASTHEAFDASMARTTSRMGAVSGGWMLDAIHGITGSGDNVPKILGGTLGYDGFKTGGGGETVIFPQSVSKVSVMQLGGARGAGAARHSAFADDGEGHWVTIDGNHILIGAPTISEQQWKDAGAARITPGEYGRTNVADRDQATAGFITPTGEVYTLTDPYGSHIAVAEKIMAAHGVPKASNMTAKETFLDRFDVTRVRLYGSQLGVESIGAVTDHQIGAVGQILAAQNEGASEPVTVYWDRPGFYDDRFDFLQSRTVTGTRMGEIRRGLADVPSPVATHAAGFRWVTLEDGRHIDIGESGGFSASDVKAGGLQHTSGAALGAGNANWPLTGMGAGAFVTRDGSVYELPDSRETSHNTAARAILANRQPPVKGDAYDLISRDQVARVRVYSEELTVETNGRPTGAQFDAVEDIHAARSRVAGAPVEILWHTLEPGVWAPHGPNVTRSQNMVKADSVAEVKASLPGGARFADEGDGHWVTIDGNHVFIGANGQATKGPPALVKALNEGKLEKGTKVQVDKAEHVPEHVKKELRTIPIEGSKEGDGSLKSPIQVGADLDRAMKLIADGKHVRLDQPRQVSTLLDRVAAQVADAKAKGDKAPNYDLGLVTVKGTNLFTQDSKGVPRAQMPQLSGKPTPGSPAAKIVGPNGEADLAPALLASLREQGVRVSGAYVKAADLRATQTELSGNKVAGMTQAMNEGKLKNQPIFVTRDNYVVDGHHRWAAKIGTDLLDNHLGDVRMPVYRVNMDIGAMLDYSRTFAAKMGIPQASVFSRIRHALADWFARFADESHWITLDDGRHILIEDSPARATARAMPELVAGVVDTRGRQHEGEDLGAAGHVENGQIIGLHVTDDPARAAQVLAEGNPISAGRDEGKYGDLGAGLYMSDAPQLWTGRSTAKWGFLKGLDQPQRQAIADAVMRDVSAPYSGVAGFEREYLQRDLNNFVEHGDSYGAVAAADQPFNVKVWTKDFLKPLGIKASPPPAEVPMAVSGTFAELKRYPTSDEVEALVKGGFDGAYMRTGFTTVPQLVVWHNEAVRRFGTYKGGVTSKAPAATHSADFADEDGHWITLDDGRHIFIAASNGAGGRGRAATPADPARLSGLLSATKLDTYAQGKIVQEIAGIKEVNLKGLDAEATLPAMKALAQLSQEYPLGEPLEFVGSTAAKDVYWPTTSLAAYQVGGWIGLTASRWNPEALDPPWQTVMASARDGWYPAAANKDPGAYPIVHEYGHAVMADLESQAPNDLSALHKSYAGAPVSDYAKAGEDLHYPPNQYQERDAESFAAYYYGSNHPDAVAMGRLLSNVYGKAPRYQANHSAFAGDDGGGHWITLDDGRHIFIEPRAAAGEGHGAGPAAAAEPAPRMTRQEFDSFVRDIAAKGTARHEREALVSQALPSHPTVSLIDLKPEMVQPQIAALTQVSHDYPAAAANLAYVGVFNGKGEPPSVYGGPTSWDGKAYAQVAPVKGGKMALGFNPSYFGTAYSKALGTPDIPAEMQRNVDVGWFPPEATNPGYTAVHEYGHVVASDLQANHPQAYNQWVTSTMAEVDGDTGRVVSGPPISGYASTGALGSASAVNERLAESFAGMYFGSHHWQADAAANALQAAYGEAPTAAKPRATAATAGARGDSALAQKRRADHAAAFADDNGRWVTLDDGRHIFIGDDPGGKYPADVRAVTARMSKAARQDEQVATTLLGAIADREGGKLAGLQYRLKLPTRTADKILDRMQTRGRNAEQAGAAIDDTLRYTMVFDHDGFVQKVADTNDSLFKAGYRVTMDNFWERGDSYNGVNGVATNRTTGAKFELQYHSPASYSVKSHPEVIRDYNVSRDMSQPVAARWAAFERMRQRADATPVPPGIFDPRMGQARLKPFVAK